MLEPLRSYEFSKEFTGAPQPRNRTCSVELIRLSTSSQFHPVWCAIPLAGNIDLERKIRRCAWPRICAHADRPRRACRADIDQTGRFVDARYGRADTRGIGARGRKIGIAECHRV